MRIALFSTCLADVMFPQAAQATVTLLERLGHEVVFPEDQVCCGQMHANTGYFEDAAKIIRNHVKTFEPVLDGQSGRHRRPPPVPAPAQHATSRRSSPSTWATSISRSSPSASLSTPTTSPSSSPTFWASRTWAPTSPTRSPTTPTCHSLRIAKVGDRPYRLLRAVEGLTLVDLPDAEVCCGFGGTFAMKNSETSTSMLADKVTNVMSTRAEVLVMGDYSCLMHVGGGLSRLNSGIRPMHLAEILASTKDQPFEGNISFAPESAQVI